MGLKFLEKGDVILKKDDYDKLVKCFEQLNSNLLGAWSGLESANGLSRNAPFREGMLYTAEKEADKAVKCAKVIDKILKGL